jgi:hypothetical protein
MEMALTLFSRTVTSNIGEFLIYTYIYTYLTVPTNLSLGTINILSRTVTSTASLIYDSIFYKLSFQVLLCTLHVVCGVWF